MEASFYTHFVISLTDFLLSLTYPQITKIRTYLPRCGGAILLVGKKSTNGRLSAMALYKPIWGVRRNRDGLSFVIDPIRDSNEVGDL